MYECGVGRQAVPAAAPAILHSGWTGDAASIRLRLAEATAAGVDEVVYAPAGPDIAGDSRVLPLRPKEKLVPRAAGLTSFVDYPGCNTDMSPSWIVTSNLRLAIRQPPSVRTKSST
jgi:hypothetical protein